MKEQGVWAGVATLAALWTLVGAVERSTIMTGACSGVAATAVYFVVTS